MSEYTEFDFLCNEPFYIKGIGNIKPPTLRDIRQISYTMFSAFLNLLTITKDKYIDSVGLKEIYDNLSNEEKADTSLYKLIISNDMYSNLFINMLHFFITDKLEYNQVSDSFDVYILNNNGEKVIVGNINEKTFDIFRESICSILNVKIETKENQKFKNKMAEKLFLKMKHSKKPKNTQDENFSLDNMIIKYCTHNKVGINILNVWDMTYYQFTKMFYEYCNGRKYDFNDMMAANTLSYKKHSDYNPMDYMKKVTN